MHIDKKNLSNLFSRVARRYDLINHILSLGQDTIWRRKIVERLNVPLHSNVLDLCSGSAELAIEFAKKPNVSNVIAVDFSEDMQNVARGKISRLGLENKIDLIRANVLIPPFKKDSFDIISIGFGLRNLDDYRKGVSEMVNMLKSGGSLMILEFSPPTSTVIGKIYRFYLRNILPFIAFLFGAPLGAYRYLSSSINSFISPEEIINYLKSNNLKNIYYEKMTFGVVYFYSCSKS